MEKPTDRRNVVTIGAVFDALEPYRQLFGEGLYQQIRRDIYDVADQSESEVLVEAEKEFVLRVLRGDVKNAQETEILPDLLRILHGLPEK